MSRDLILDLGVLVALVVFATGVSIFVQANFILSTALYFLLPCIYLAYRLRHRRQWRRIITMAVVFGILYGFFFAYIAELNGAWAWPAASIFGGGLLFSVVNPAALIWLTLWVTYITMFYEHFLERDNRDKISPRVWYAVVPILLILALTYATAQWTPQLLSVPYAYATLVLLTLPPCILLLYWRPRLYRKIALPALFFIPLHLVHEAVGLALGHWYFPGAYIAHVPFVGGAFVPIEEFIFWIILGSIIVIAYYELYIDDMR